MTTVKDKDPTPVGAADAPQSGRREVRLETVYSEAKAAPEKAILPAQSSVKKKTSSSNDIPFDSSAPELVTTWSSHARVIMCVNSYPNGITVSLHAGEGSQPQVAGESDVEGGKKYQPSQFHLRFRDTRDYQLPAGKYFLYKKNPLEALEKHLSLLHQRNLLQETVLYFGTITDPFLSFHKKFDLTTGCLEVFSHYRPARIVLQTRSPMIIAALPMLKLFGDKATAAIHVESHLEKSIARYTPGKPKLSERLVAAQGLRRQGVMVNLLVSPVLPYGDLYRNAWDFAELLERHGDYITFGCLATGSEATEKQLKNLPIAQKLAADEQFQWLRPHAFKYVYHALKVIAPEKLQLPVKAPVKPSQLTLFAA